MIVLYGSDTLLTIFCLAVIEKGVERHVEVENLPQSEVSSKVSPLLGLS